MDKQILWPYQGIGYSGWCHQRDKLAVTELLIDKTTTPAIYLQIDLHIFANESNKIKIIKTYLFVPWWSAFEAYKVSSGPILLSSGTHAGDRSVVFSTGHISRMSGTIYSCLHTKMHTTTEEERPPTIFNCIVSLHLRLAHYIYNVCEQLTVVDNKTTRHVLLSSFLYG